jgi:hypothetical protein
MAKPPKTLDSETLSSEASRRFRELVDAAHFFDLPFIIQAHELGADEFQYTVTIELDGRSHTVRMPERPAPETLRALVDYLVDARQGARAARDPPATSSG